MVRASATAACLIAAAICAAQDEPRRRAETITSSRHEYTIPMGGTVDGQTTRDPIVYAAWCQTFEPMRFVRLENIGDADVVNPWVLVNGKRNWRTVKDIVGEALRSYGDPRTMTDAEKARALWDFQRLHRFHATTGDMEVRDPVKMYNVYGFSLCGDNAPVLSDLWRVAGLRTRRGFPIGHCVSEVWYEGAWHMLDADESVIFLDRDNETIVSEKAVARDHDLAKRAYRDEMLGSLYNYDGAHGGDYPSHIGHTMQFTLRPGEAIEWRWDHSGKHHYWADPPLYSLDSTHLKAWGEKAWALLCNGKWVYSPPLRKASAQRGSVAENVSWTARAGAPAISPAKAGKPARITWRIQAPYVIVGGSLSARVRCPKGSACVFRISMDNAAWQEIARVEGAGAKEIRESLDRFFPNRGPAVYRYFVQAEMLAPSRAAPTGLDALTIEDDLQMAPLSLPALELGPNRIAYTDETPGPHAVRLTFDWVERSSAKPPAAPAAPVYPADGADVEGTRFTFAWRDAEAAAGDSIADYHFQLSGEPGFRWALTPAFDTMISATESKGKAAFAIQREGLLNPGQRYYWRVRAKSAAGVWGPWSHEWSFVPQGPGVPLNVRLEERGPHEFALLWDANTKGRKPARFKIYASDEKGFSVSDEPYRAPVGNQKTRGLFPGEKSRVFPANLLATSAGPSFRLKPTHAFYRVVAVDAMGNSSGASDYAAAPRPFIYSTPPAEAKAGAPFRYEAKTIASIGDLSYRDFGPGQSYQAAFWDADRPEFSLVVEMPRCGNFTPEWMKIDPKTGVLSGTPRPSDAGEYQVNVKVEIPGAGSYIQSFPLRVSK